MIAGRTNMVVAGLILASALFFSGPTSAESNGTEIRAPEGPAVPAVDAGGKKGPAGQADFPATVTTAKGESMTGSLLLSFDAIEVDTAEEGPERKKSIPLASIKTIEFTQWRGTLRRKNEYAFYPARVKITLRDGKAYQCTRVAPALNRVLFKDYRGKRVLYAYFFDYRDGTTWKNSGETEMKYPETNPFAGTVVRIDFTAAEMRNPLEFLFKQLVPGSL